MMKSNSDFLLRKTCVCTAAIHEVDVPEERRAWQTVLNFREDHRYADAGPVHVGWDDLQGWREEARRQWEQV